jgi:hypothetical protein
MGWIQQANKIGKYKTTWNAFRIYVTRQTPMKQYVDQRTEGSVLVTEFGKNEYTAIDKTGCKINDFSLEGIAFKIDFEVLSRRK